MFDTAGDINAQEYDVTAALIDVQRHLAIYTQVVRAFVAARESETRDLEETIRMTDANQRKAEQDLADAHVGYTKIIDELRGELASARTEEAQPGRTSVDNEHARVLARVPRRMLLTEGRALALLDEPFPDTKRETLRGVIRGLFDDRRRLEDDIVGVQLANAALRDELKIARDAADGVRVFHCKHCGQLCGCETPTAERGVDPYRARICQDCGRPCGYIATGIASSSGVQKP